ncbi:MAG: sigma-70 family RNA polymerase sigma factor [Acidobacteria bacterium]|nr:sigma-70 family RNA polymerase sigma factor [Acidobacteriota bacterium]
MTLPPSVDEAIVDLFNEHARSLVRLARFFVDDRNAAEDLVQEAFLRLHGSFHRVENRDRAVAYLRSIVLNLARDHNRRGLLSLRHRLPEQEGPMSVEDRLVMREDQREVFDAPQSLPKRQRDCLALRYYLNLSPPDIAATLDLSVNSVKTHLRRGLDALEARLEARR